MPGGEFGGSEVRIHGIGNHASLSAIGSPRKRDGSHLGRKETETALVEAPLPESHALWLAAWTRSSRALNSFAWYLGLPFTPRQAWYMGRDIRLGTSPPEIEILRPRAHAIVSMHANPLEPETLKLLRDWGYNAGAPPDPKQCRLICGRTSQPSPSVSPVPVYSGASGSHSWSHSPAPEGCAAPLGMIAAVRQRAQCRHGCCGAPNGLAWRGGPPRLDQRRDGARSRGYLRDKFSPVRQLPIAEPRRHRSPVYAVVWCSYYALIVSYPVQADRLTRSSLNLPGCTSPPLPGPLPHETSKLCGPCWTLCLAREASSASAGGRIGATSRHARNQPALSAPSLSAPPAG